MQDSKHILSILHRWLLDLDPDLYKWKLLWNRSKDIILLRTAAPAKLSHVVCCTLRCAGYLRPQLRPDSFTLRIIIHRVHPEFCRELQQLCYRNQGFLRKLDIASILGGFAGDHHGYWTEVWW